MADNDQKGKKQGPKPPDELAPATTSHHDGEPHPPRDVIIREFPDAPLDVNVTSNAFDVTLQGTAVPDTHVLGFWEYLRQRTDAISFSAYNEFIKQVLCKGSEIDEGTGIDRTMAIKRGAGVDNYDVLHAATEAFLLMNTGSLGTTAIDPKGVSSSRFGGKKFTGVELQDRLNLYLGTPQLLPYIKSITDGLDIDSHGPNSLPVFCDDLDEKVLRPIFIELIWSYWHEEAMVVQAINALSLRFQNKRTPGDRDPLANFETHPLRPMANLFWGYIQGEDDRLTVARRAYEYEHEYGLTLVGRAVPRLRPADRRSKFLEAFHTLLHQTAVFYDRSANLTVRADAFPLLNALREVHLILAEGAHNQFREMPWTSRVEMLIQQWLLSRREVREFVGGRPAVPYSELWMSSVDALRRAMGWGDTASSHFNDLAVTGEKIVLSVRYGNWSDRKSEDDAAGWATFWKPEIQRYIHAYHTVTGVDLSATTNLPTREIDSTPPSLLLQQRVARQRR